VNTAEAHRVSKFVQHGWPGDFTEEALAIYLDALTPLPFEAVATAIKGMLLTCKFRPSIAEVYSAAVAQLGGSAPPLAEALGQGRQWVRYLEQMQWSNGSGYVPQAPEAHPLVVRCCGSMRDFDEHSFRRAYIEAAQNYNAEAVAALSSQPAIGAGA